MASKIPLISAVYLATIACGAVLPAMAAGHPEVLVVYNSNAPDSLTVAQYYMSRRDIPAANLCAIAPPATDYLTLTDYANTIKAPVQACLNAAGKQNILYIVFSYLTPYGISGALPDTGAVDSFVADIWDVYQPQPWTYGPTHTHGYYADSQDQGNVYAPFQSFAAYRASTGAPTIYSVWRLDGASVANAERLVDFAIQTESQGGLSGQGCFDLQYGPAPGQADYGYSAGDWDIHAAGSMLSRAGFPVTEDDNNAEFGTAPAPLTCPATAFYAGWYSYNNYNNAFTWQPGAIGWHLDSASAVNPRGGTNWSANALQAGITVTTGSVSEPYLTGLVRPGGTFRNLLQGASVGDALLRNTRWLKWVNLYMGDPLYRPFPNGVSPFNPPRPGNAFQLSPGEVVGGKPSTATLAMATPAPSGGMTFSLSSGNTNIATVPATATIRSGRSSVTFTVNTRTLAQSAPVVLTATAGSLTLSNTLAVDPLLNQLWSASRNASAGNPVSMQVILNAKAPSTGVVVSLFSTNPSVVSVPNTVTVPAGATSATFWVTTTPVTTSTQARISASYAGAIQSWYLNVVPAISGSGLGYTPLVAGKTDGIWVSLATPAPAGGATLTLTSSDPSIISLPATLLMPAGTTYGQQQFTPVAGSAGTNVQITISYGGSVQTIPVAIN